MFHVAFIIVVIIITIIDISLVVSIRFGAVFLRSSLKSRNCEQAYAQVRVIHTAFTYLSTALTRHAE